MEVNTRMADTFSFDHVKQVVQLALRSLEEEDQFVRECMASNPACECNHRQDGISYLESERYYQVFTARSLLKNFPYRVEMEYNRFDLAFFGPQDATPTALCEMKLWLSGSGKDEIGEILKDIEKLSRQQCHQFLIIYTRFIKGGPTLEQNVGWLLQQLKCSEQEHFGASFDTKYYLEGKGVSDAEFGVIGILLK